jgi:hypothetical protein
MISERQFTLGAGNGKGSHRRDGEVGDEWVIERRVLD